MSEVEKRLHELQAKSETALDHAERAALAWLHAQGVADLQGAVLRVEGPDRWPTWAAEAIVWTVGRIRAGERREALRGFGQIREYQGRNGGFLPVGLSDHVGTIQNLLEALICPDYSLNGARVIRRGDTIFVPLPRAAWAPALGGGKCACPPCKAKGATESYWDTLAIAAEKPKADSSDTCWTVHMPEAQR